MPDMHTSAAEVGSEVRRPVLRACIVDDHVAVRQWLADQLEGLGIEVCASSGTLVDGAAAVLHNVITDMSFSGNRVSALR